MINDIETTDALSLGEGAAAACQYLRALANPSRLALLCELNGAEKSVGELENALGMSQAYVSQQLARLRSEGLVEGRRDGRAIFYRISDSRVLPMIELLHAQFCAD